MARCAPGRGFFPKDEASGVSRDIRRELFDALDNEIRHGKKTYRAADEAAAEQFATGRGASNLDKEIEAEAKSLRRTLKNEAGIAEPDTVALYKAAEQVHMGYARDPLDAYEAAVMALERGGGEDIAAVPRPAAVAPTASLPPAPMNYQGIKDLRSHVGELFKRPPEGMSGTELKRIYGALTEDLRLAAKTAGGDEGLAAFDKANRIHSMIEGRREALAKIVGKRGDASPAQIFDSLLAAAKTNTPRAETARLLLARKAMGPQAWDGFVGGVIGRLWETPDKFLTAYGNLSDRGKSILFDSTGRSELRRSLDDMAAVATRLRDWQRKFGNPSGTAQNVSVFATATAMLTNPILTLTSLVGGNVAARALSAPATAKSASAWAKAQEAAVTNPTPQTVSAFQRASAALARALAAAGARVSAEQLAAPVMKALNDNMRGMRSTAASEQDKRDNRQK